MQLAQSGLSEAFPVQGAPVFFEVHAHASRQISRETVDQIASNLPGMLTFLQHLFRGDRHVSIATASTANGTVFVHMGFFYPIQFPSDLLHSLRIHLEKADCPTTITATKEESRSKGRK